MLPKPRIDPYQYETPDAVERTEKPEARVGMRRRFTQRTTRAQVTWLMTAEQFRIFSGFWVNIIGRGVGKFTVALATGSGMSERIARFAEPYTATLVAPVSLWTVSATLELEAEGVVAYASPAAGEPHELSITLSAASSSQSGSTLDGNLSTPTITSSVAGGVAPYTYQWTKQSGNAFGLANGSLASSQVFQSSAPIDSSVLTAVYRLTVTDSYGSTAYDEITITHTYERPFAFLLEGGDYLLLESGARILLE